MESVRRQEITLAFEYVINCIAFETGPLGQMCNGYLAHIVDEMLLEFPSCRKLLHGERVGYAVFPELIQAGRSDQITPLVRLYRKIGLPCTLRDLGIPDVTYRELREAAVKANSKIMASLTVHRFSPDEMAQAIIAAEEYIENI